MTRRRRLPAVAVASATALALALTAFPPSTLTSVAAPTFATQHGGRYDGLPLFDGVPGHLDAYLDVLMDYAGLTVAVELANGVRGDLLIPDGSPNAGKVVPGAPQFAEGLQGISTDMPAALAVSQSWNLDLSRAVGEVIGNEKLYTQNYATGQSQRCEKNQITGNDDYISCVNAMISAPQQDIRVNPLSGRIDEGFGEDSGLASAMVDAQSRGMSGIDDPSNPDGFWTKALLDTKHFTNYAAQWYRIVGSDDASARSLMEYWSVPAIKSIESGALGGIMTSYGRTNGVPNAISPLIQYAQSKAPWVGIYGTPDNGSESSLHAANRYSNGFDTQYTPTWGDAAALLAVADSGGISATPKLNGPNAALVERVAAGAYGVTPEHIYELAKKQVAPLVRMGLYNVRDAATNLPVGYSFTGLTASQSTTALDYTNRDHQQVALQAGLESIVLLKNEHNVLPLSKNSDLAVVGPLSNQRFTTTRAITAPAGLANSSLNPAQGIKAVATGDVSVSDDVDVVRLKDSQGNYLTLGAESSPLLYANGTADNAAQFEVFNWGQGATSLRATGNGRWVQYNATTGMNVGGTSTGTMPNRLQLQSNSDGTVSIIANAYTSGFGGGFETALYTGGRYARVSDGRVGVTGLLTNAATARDLNTADTRFTVEVVKAQGADATRFRTDDGAEYAVVVIGDSPRNSAGEGADRSDLYLGARQYDYVKTVAAAYPGRTIVVLSSTYPVIVDEIQKNHNVAAIVQFPYAGEYSGLALGKVLFGDYAPTGRLSTTWYATMGEFPALDDYSIPEGTNATVTRADLDPRFTVDMTNGDPVETKLGYRYTDARVTYPFGYGLGYSTFGYRDLSVKAGSDGKYTATLYVTNNGTVDTSEVVQVYAANPGSTYGDAAPKRQLLAFDKVAIRAGQTKKVTIDFTLENAALWDVNSNTLRVEPGTYDLWVGSASDDQRLTTQLKVNTTDWAPLDATTAPVNVFDHSFAMSDVTYRESSKQTTVDGLQADKLVDGYYTVMSRKQGSWTALSNVAFKGNESKVTLSVASTNAQSSLSLRLDSPKGTLLGTAEFGSTGSNAYTIKGLTEAGDIPVKEIGYTSVDIPLTAPVEGNHDLYVVFGGRDVRVRDLQLVPSATPLVKAPLEQAIAAAQQLADAAIPASVASSGLGAAIDAARVVLASAETQKALDEALTALNTAVAEAPSRGLEIRDSASARLALTQTLQTAATAYAALDQGSYTPASWSVLASALESARAVSANPNATVDQLKSALEGLQRAATALVPVQKTTAPVASKVKLNQSQLRLVKGKSLTLEDRVYFSNAPSSYAATTWKSSNTAVATVSSSGTVKAKKSGTVTITATTIDKGSAGAKLSTSIKVTVVAKKPTAKVTTVSASVPKTIAKGQSVYITGTYSSAKATGVKVTYASSRASVAEIDKVGRIQAKGMGTVKITVKAGGRSKAYTVTVK